MKTKYVTSLELSKKLKEAGIKQESELVWTKDYEWSEYYLTNNPLVEPFDSISAFHVGELGEMLPRELEIEFFKIMDAEGWRIFVTHGKIRKIETADTEAEARGKMVLYLKKENLV